MMDNEAAGEQLEMYGEQQPVDSVAMALAEQRASKKRVQDDVKLLANRIALLKLEEKKAWKKIEETKKKATEIMKVRQRNNETKAYKEQMRMQREQEERQRQEQNLNSRANQRDAIKYNKQSVHAKAAAEAERLKQERIQHQQMIDQQRDNDAMRAQTMKQMIRREKDEQKEMRAHEQALKRQQQRLDLIRRINEENEQRIQIQT